MHEEPRDLTTRLTTKLLRCLAKALVTTADELERSSLEGPPKPRDHSPDDDRYAF